MLPQALQAALHGLLKSHDFVSGVNTTIQAGGCNASRAGFIGACMAAQYGLENVPENWRKKTLLITEITDLCKKLVTIQL